MSQARLRLLSILKKLDYRIAKTSYIQFLFSFKNKLISRDIPEFDLNEFHRKKYRKFNVVASKMLAEHMIPNLIVFNYILIVLVKSDILLSIQILIPLGISLKILIWVMGKGYAHYFVLIIIIVQYVYNLFINLNGTGKSFLYI